MKGFLNKKGVRLNAEKNQKSNELDENLIEWSEIDVSDFVDLFESILDKKTCLDLEKRARSVKSASSWGIHCASSRCCGGEDEHHHKIPFVRLHCFQKAESDEIGKLLTEFCSRDFLSKTIPAVLQKSKTVYEGVMNRSKKDGLSLLEEDEYNIHLEVLKEALVRCLLNAVSEKFQETAIVDSKEGGLLALPAGYKGSRSLDCLSSETVGNLMKKSHCMQSDFLGNSDLSIRVFQEIESLEREGILSETYRQGGFVDRKELMCFVTFEDLDRSRHRGLVALFEAFIALPFELNGKTPLSLQGSASFCLSCLPSSGGFQSKHMDSGYDDRDTGRKISAIYFPINPKASSKKRKCGEEGGKILLGPVEEGGEVSEYVPEGDALLMFKARDCPIEITPCSSRLLSICFFVHGVAGPGEKGSGK